MALGLDGAAEGSHMGHADFRVKGRVFATLGYPDEGHGMVKLAPEEQEARMSGAPGVFRPAPGAWGRQGSTLVRLDGAAGNEVRGAMASAWGLAVSMPAVRPRRKRLGRGGPGAKGGG
jgi:hypothetical protein